MVAKAQGTLFRWWLWPPYEVQLWAFDEIVAVPEGFRIRLIGSILELSFEASGTCSPSSAKALADKYVEILARHARSHLSLLTEGEYGLRTEPPFGNANNAFFKGRLSRSEGNRLVRETRNEILASTDESLRRCYDYMQDARDATPDVAAAAVYKAIEVLEVQFGGQSKAVVALGKIVKEAKKAANEKRHIPEKGQPQPKASGEPVELTRQVIQRYEQYLLDLHGGKTSMRP